MTAAGLLPSLDALLPWIEHYGYLAVFGLLVLGVVGVPIPDEWLLLFTGYLVERHELALLPALLAGWGGAAGGITVSYLLGRGPGRAAVARWGRYLHLDTERLDRVRRWYDRTGHWLLTFGFFIPGVRHLTAIVAGTSELKWPRFALFAYAGAGLWALVFVLTGYWVGEEWRTVADRLRGHHLLLVGMAAAVLVGFWAYRRRR
jgi:membrane protein DedA with SNARE-associated domain